MSDTGTFDRREFIKASALIAGAAAIPLSTAIAQGGSMITRPIPGTNERLPVIGLGAPEPFIDLPPEGKELPISLINAMMEMGGTVMDSPSFFRPNVPVFGPLINEMGVRDDLFLIGKSTVNGRENVINHLDKLMVNLDKYPMDSLLIHNMREMDVQWPILKELKAQGKVRHIGLSLTRQVDYGPLVSFMATEKPDIVMTGYSITQQGPANSVLPFARDNGIAIIGVEPFKAVDDGAFFSMVAGKELPDWAAEIDVHSWAQFSLKWIISDPAITSVVTETVSVKHVIDNMGGGYGHLPDQAMRQKMSDLLLSFA